MKKLKKTLTILFILALIISLWYKNGYMGKKYKSTQFLFDTTCSITAYGKDAKNVVEEAFSAIEEIHSLTNFYSETSDVAKINSAKKDEKVKIDKRTFEIILAAQKISEDSNGAFDITIAPLSVLWNFKDGENIVPDEVHIKDALKKVDWHRLELLKNENCVVKKEDIKIDLGGAAKGYACDAAVEVLEKYNLCGIVDLGGNIGCTGENPDSENGLWRIGLQTPFEPTGTFEEKIELDAGSVVTSGNYQRYFEKDGKVYHHILDPKTGYPKTASYNAVSVKAENSLLADLISTAAFVLGEEDGRALAEKYGAEIYFY